MRTLQETVEPYQQIDLDQLAEWGAESTPSLAGILHLFVEALKQIRAVSDDLVLWLAISLEPAPELTISIPDVTRIRDEVARMESHGLYVLSPRAFLKPWDFEEFRAPLDPPAHWGLPPGVNLRYSCFRSPAARADGSDWERVIWIEYWPGLE